MSEDYRERTWFRVLSTYGFKQADGTMRYAQRESYPLRDRVACRGYREGFNMSCKADYVKHETYLHTETSILEEAFVFGGPPPEMSEK